MEEFKIKYFFKIFFILILPFFLIGCKKKHELIKKEVFLQETNSEEIENAGIFISPNFLNLRCFKEEDFFVCDYDLNLDFKEKENKEILLKNFIEPFKKIYIQRGWVLQEPIFNDKNITISGYKENKNNFNEGLFIVFLLNFSKKKGKYKITVHTAINVFS